MVFSHKKNRGTFVKHVHTGGTDKKFDSQFFVALKWKFFVSFLNRCSSLNKKYPKCLNMKCFKKGG